MGLDSRFALNSEEKRESNMECPHKTALRPELEKLPARMTALPVDERGYVVPWFVDWLETEPCESALYGEKCGLAKGHAGLHDRDAVFIRIRKPEFRAMDPRKWVRAIKEKLCWVCGDRLGRHMTFVAGPMCGINRTSSEPPSHLECAQWSARNCPFLNNPDAIRREDETSNPLSKCVGGVGIQRNPGMAMLWTTNTYTVFDDGRGGRLLNMGEPASVEWYAEGKLATREQILTSIDSGFPALAEIALKQDGAMKYLMECREKFERYIPA